VSPTGAATATTSRCLIHSNQPANVLNIVFRWAPGWHPEAVDRRDIAVRQGCASYGPSSQRSLANAPRYSRTGWRTRSRMWQPIGVGSTSEGLSGEIEIVATQDPGCKRLMTVPGIGPIISSAMVDAIIITTVGQQHCF
jgi:hypothetical protein